MSAHALTRRTMLKAGALTVGFALAGLQTRAEGATPTPRMLVPTRWIPSSPWMATAP